MRASSSHDVAPTHVSPSPSLTAQAHAGTADELSVRGACMNLGGGGGHDSDYMTSVWGQRHYPERLERELLALLDTRDVVGITEINPYWFGRTMATRHFSGDGRYRGCHDTYDVAIFWNKDTVEPIDPLQIHNVYPSFLPAEIPLPETRHLSWRDFLCVKFRLVASPHDTFTAVCTHSLSGNVVTKDRITEPKGHTSEQRYQFKQKIATRVMEKGLRYCHLPSVVTERRHFLLVLGDWNIPLAHFGEAVIDAKQLAGDATSEFMSMAARDTTERDLFACYYRRSDWFVSRDDDIPAATIAALSQCTNVQHVPMFFSVVAVGDETSEELESPQGVAAAIGPPGTASARAQVGLQLERVHRNADMELPAHPPVNTWAKSIQTSQPRTDPDISS